MATAPSSARIGPDTRERIYSPLYKLRGIIRRYLVWESLALTVILLTTWYWLGLFLDYGIFKLTGVDWVQVLPLWLRAIGLFVVSLGVTLLVFRNLTRLLRRLRPRAL